MALQATPIRVLPDFTKPFVVKIDASVIDIGVILKQSDHPIMYIIKTLTVHHQGLSAYEKQLLAMVFTVRKWNYYFIDRHLIIPTNQQSLMYLLEQKVFTPLQNTCLDMLLGFYYENIYKSGNENIAIDALSWLLEPSVVATNISCILSIIMLCIRLNWETGLSCQQLITTLQQGQRPIIISWNDN